MRHWCQLLHRLNISTTKAHIELWELKTKIGNRKRCYSATLQTTPPTTTTSTVAKATTTASDIRPEAQSAPPHSSSL